MNTESSPAASFYRFSQTAQQITETRSINDKINLFSAYLKTLNDDDNIGLAVRFMGEGAFSTVSDKRASVGHVTIARCAAAFCETDYDLVFRACKTATGSASVAIELLMDNIPEAAQKRNPEYLLLSETARYYERLEKARKREEKEQILTEVWQKMTPVEIKYFIRVLSQGSLRVGLEAKSIVNALSEAWDCDPEAVRYAHMLSGSLAKTAILARHDHLDSARFHMFHPLSFMLASPVETKNVEDITAYVAEEKFDGMRCQLHASGDKTCLYARDLNDITHSVPEITRHTSSLNLPEVVMDGELCVYKDEIIQPFQHLQKRMGVKKPTAKLMADYPVVFIAFDILFLRDKPLFDEPLNSRRRVLREFCEQYGLMMSRQFEPETHEDVDQLFEQALAHGNEGLMLKKKDSPYEYGQRRKTWLKVKKPGGSIDTIIMYAHAGSSKRGGIYSAFTLGVRVSEDERYEEEFIPIGKINGGYTDKELKKLNSAIKPLIVERFGPTLSLKPGIVVEIEFDDIQENKRTKAGLALRLPRFRAIRRDLTPADTDTLKDVERLFGDRVNKSRASQKYNPALLMF